MLLRLLLGANSVCPYTAIECVMSPLPLPGSPWHAALSALSPYQFAHNCIAGQVHLVHFGECLLLTCVAPPSHPVPGTETCARTACAPPADSSTYRVWAGAEASHLVCQMPQGIGAVSLLVAPDGSPISVK